MDLITVGITCFNAEDTIERAVRSAQAQTWDNIEIVVADDASRDRSRAIVQQLASGDARIRVVHHETNSG
ncbi:MAG TPA: glycosyltransferase family 2 protein, partial [Candidatus Krumholzibacteria bacterium]|nr:glycosyltransferase family 2 protein [Candidatus Krumholzibacteria bacterium]